jgi:uncharacterized protein
MIRVPLSERGPVDMHVHLVGNGLGGSGCWLRPGFSHRLLANWMLRQVGLRVSWASAEFDAAYAQLLATWLRQSALSHAVVLGHEEVYSESGERLSFGSFYVPNDYVFAVCERHHDLLPAVSIHPARPDALDELDRCLERGTVMMKCLPNCQNIDTRLPRYRSFWDRMAAARLPLLAHSGGEHTVPVYNAALADPETLVGALDAGVTVIAAHCATRSGLRDPDYLLALIDLMGRYHNLYADLSALNLPYRSAGMVEMLRRPELFPRLLHGSDFPVPVQPAWAKMRRILSPADAKRCGKIANLIDRDFRLKEAVGFPPIVFHQVWNLLRVAR